MYVKATLSSWERSFIAGLYFYSSTDDLYKYFIGLLIDAYDYVGA